MIRRPPGSTLSPYTTPSRSLVNGDTPATFSTLPNTPPTVTTTATAASHAGTSDITASGAADSDYTISYVKGTLTVKAVALTITAHDHSKDYCAALPSLTVTY